MIRSMMRSLPRLGPKWTPLNFNNPNFTCLPSDQPVEEETWPQYVASRFYPTKIGEVLQNRYQIVGKLGVGVTSTAWLARDMDCCRYVAIKIMVNAASMGQHVDNELKIYERIQQASKLHPGHECVRSLIDSFDINGPEDTHRCLVHPALWESVNTFLCRNPIQRLPPIVLAVTLHRLFLALDYLHTECKVIHTDLRADNLMFSINDDTIFSDFEKNELEDPSPRKVVDGRTIYTSRELGFPSDPGAPVLCDFGSAVRGDEEHTEDVQPNVYRSPEVILEVPWTYSTDIWNAGCLIFDLFQGGSLFNGRDPEFHTYRSRTHLAEMISLLGPPPPEFLERANLKRKFFNEKGEFSAGIKVGEHVPFEALVTGLEGESREKFIQLLRKILQWEPEKRLSARELATDEWIQMEIQPCL